MLANSFRQLFTPCTTYSRHLFHHAAPQLARSEDDKNDPADGANVPIQTFDKSLIVAKLWKTKGELILILCFLLILI